MSYDSVTSALIQSVEVLPPQRRAAAFWASGQSLLRSLREPELPPEWALWASRAANSGREYVVNGFGGEECQTLMDCALSADPVDNASQLFNSMVICVNTPLIIAIDPEVEAAEWIEQAIFPKLQEVSLRLYEDIAVPDDEGLDEIAEDEEFRAAVEGLLRLCHDLTEVPSINSDWLLEVSSQLAL